MHNPFNVTKATDFTDEEIIDYWVDFYSNNGENLLHHLNPSDLTPKYITGGKGCGKTHLLRYHSFTLQKLRKQNDIRSIINDDGYIGLNIELGSLSSARMSGCSVSVDQWDSIFGYYLELFVGIKLTELAMELSTHLEVPIENQKKVIDKIKNTICPQSIDGHNSKIGDFRDLKQYFTTLKKEVDYQINNAALRRGIEFGALNILFNPGDVFFEFPKILTEEIPELAEIKFIFILDELERLREYQKIYINTLVWDRRKPCTFWIGSRTYGFTTRETKTGEILKNGSEYQNIFLDGIMSENEERYHSFALNLCYQRLKKAIKIAEESDSEKMKQKIDSFFEYFDEDKILNRILETKKKEFSHQKSFKIKIKEGIERKQLRGLDISEIDRLFTEHIKDSNLLTEKLKILFFYKEWSRTISLEDILRPLAEEFAKHNSGTKSKFTSLVEKYKFDLLAQLLFENNLKIFPYSGINILIRISSENPRALLVIMKEIFERAKLNNEDPFEDGKIISMESQSLGIYFASKWFYEDTEAYGEDGKKLYKCIYNLATLLQGIRFSDKPSEVSPSSFSYKPDKTSDQAEKFIHLAETHRIIISCNGRRDKNSERIEESYQLNRMVAPYLNLPISRRGIVPFNESLVESIFNPDKHTDFQSLFNDLIGKMNAPFRPSGQTEIFA